MARDLNNRRFERLLVISGPIVERVATGTNISHMVRCDCGTEKKVKSSSLVSGKTRSCGCLVNTRALRHGETHTPLYAKWRGIMQRCYYPMHASYKNYGGRGITVCKEWKEDYLSFRNWALANGYADDLEPDRIDNNRGYSPDNVQWVSRLDNCQNKRNSINITAFGETKTVAEWIRDDRCVITNRNTLVQRLKRLQWPAEKAITLRPNARR